MTQEETLLAPLNQGMTYELTREFLIFSMLFKTYENNIDAFKNRIDWQFEQYYQMIESDTDLSFIEWLKSTIEMHEDINIERREHLSSRTKKTV